MTSKESGQMHFISLPKQEENVLFQGKIFYVLGFDTDKAKDIKMVIESFGGTVTHNLTSETTYVVTTPEESKKNSMSIREAIDLGVPVVSESFIWQATVTRSSAGLDSSLNVHRLSLSPGSEKSISGLQSSNVTPYVERSGFEFGEESSTDMATPSLAISSNDKDFVEFDRKFYVTTSEDALDGDSEDKAGLSEEIGVKSILLPFSSVADADARLEWQRLLTSYLTGEDVAVEKRRIQNRSIQDSAEYEKFRDNLYYGIIGKLYSQPMALVPAWLSALRSDFVKDAVSAVVTFEGNFNGDFTAFNEQLKGVLHLVDAVESMYPSYRKLCIDQPVFETIQGRLDILRTWSSLFETIRQLHEIVKKWANVKDLAAELPDEFIESVLKEGGLPKLFTNHSVITAVNLMVDKAIDSLKLLCSEDSKALGLPIFEDDLLLVGSFPGQIIKKCVTWWVKSENAGEPTEPESPKKKSSNAGSHDIAMDLDALLEDYKVCIQSALGTRQNYRRLLSALDSKNENILDNETIVQGVRLYLKILERKLSSSKNQQLWFRNAELLEKEWDFLQKNVYSKAKDFQELRTLAAEKFCFMTERLFESLLFYYHQSIRINDPTKSDKNSSREKWFTRLLFNVRIRCRKVLQYARQLKEELEESLLVSCNEATFPSCVEYILEHDLDPKTTNTKTESPPTVFMVTSRIAIEDKQYFVSFLTTKQSLWNSRTCSATYPKLLSKKQIMITGISDNDFEAFREFLKNNYHETSFVFDQCSANKRVDSWLLRMEKTVLKTAVILVQGVKNIRRMLLPVDLVEEYFTFASSFGKIALSCLPQPLRVLLTRHLLQLAIEWISFTCSDCLPTDPKTIRWALLALEFVMWVIKGNNILVLSNEAFLDIKRKVACCMALIIGGLNSAEHFDHGMSKKKNEKVTESLTPEDVARIAEMRLQKVLNIDKVLDMKASQQKRIGKIIDHTEPANQNLNLLLKVSNSKVSMRWQQGKFIGGGTFGSVYVGINLESGDLMAVKEIKFQSNASSKMILSIKEEMKVLEVLNHPNIVNYYGVELHRDKCYIFMEFCSGGSLSSLLENGRIENESIIQLYSYQLYNGLQYLHSKDIVHRDIKPDNILLDKSGTIKLVDFGAAKMIVNQGTLNKNNKNSLVGTPNYMAPEIINGQKTAAPIGSQDVWSAACVVLEMITGKRPWSHLDNDWAIMYQIGISNQHPPIPPVSANGSDSSNNFNIHLASPQAASNSARPSISETQSSSDENITSFTVTVSQKCSDFLEKCLKPADKRATASQLLYDPWFEELEQKLTEYRMNNKSSFPNAWSGFITGLYSPGFSFNTLASVNVGLGTRELLGSYFSGATLGGSSTDNTPP